MRIGCVATAFPMSAITYILHSPAAKFSKAWGVHTSNARSTSSQLPITFAYALPYRAPGPEPDPEGWVSSYTLPMLSYRDLIWNIHHHRQSVVSYPLSVDHASNQESTYLTPPFLPSTTISNPHCTLSLAVPLPLPLLLDISLQSPQGIFSIPPPYFGHVVLLLTTHFMKWVRRFSGFFMLIKDFWAQEARDSVADDGRNAGA